MRRTSERAEKLAEDYIMDIEDYSTLDAMDDQEKAEAVVQWLIDNGHMNSAGAQD